LLHLSVIPAGSPNTERTGVFLHGILGSGRNWRSFASRLTRSFPGWRWVLVDLRCHGESAAHPPPHNLSVCGRDVAEALAPHSPDAIIGHSFGGKVALSMMAEGHIPHTTQVFVLDSHLGVRTPSSPTAALVDDVLEVLAQVPSRTATRGEMRQALEQSELPSHLIAWLLTSLQQREDGWRWCYDLAGVRALMDSYHETTFWPLIESMPPSSTPRLHVVRAVKGSHWSAEDVARLEGLHDKGALQHTCLDRAGHWLHVDDPEGLEACLRAGLVL
jgi:pimeloyl-ACP methyl ester carboxylesterase